MYTYYAIIYCCTHNNAQDCRSSIMEVFSEGETHIGQVCEEVLDICLAKGSRDNMSAVIVAFDALKIGKGKVSCSILLFVTLYYYMYYYTCCTCIVHAALHVYCCYCSAVYQLCSSVLSLLLCCSKNCLRLNMASRCSVVTATYNIRE
jgi:hypothetical protein